MNYLSMKKPYIFNEVISLIPEYGCWKDLVDLRDTKEEAVLELVSTALLNRNSLCAKWMPRKGNFANALRKYMGMTPKEYRNNIFLANPALIFFKCHDPPLSASRYKSLMT